jgi:zinc protease
MELGTFPGQITMSMLSEDIHHGFSMLREVLCNATLKEDGIERVRDQLLAEITSFWDTPTQFSSQLIREAAYGDHPYGKNIFGSFDTVKNITQDDLKAAYDKYIVPEEARIAIVGDLASHDVESIIEKTLGNWQGTASEAPTFPDLKPVEKSEINYTINRDQTVLCYGGLSVSRSNKDFDKLLLFDQIFTGGILGGMNSRLFTLREQSGMFYAIGGSLLAGVSKDAGMILVKALCSNENLGQAQDLIEATIKDGAAGLTEEELEQAQKAIINSLVDNFDSNKQMAGTFIFLDKYNMQDDYFDVRAQNLLDVTLSEVQDAVSTYLDVEKLIRLRVGRV